MRGNCAWVALGSGIRSSGGAGIVLATLLVSGWLTSADAQIRKTALNREEGDRYIKDLEQQRNDFGTTRMNSRTPARPLERLNTPTAEMKAIRPLITEFADEISILKSLLIDEVGQTPAIKSLLSDAYQITADCALLDKQARTENNHIALLDDLRQIDAAWGELSHRLGTVRRLSKDAKDHIANLNDIAGEIRSKLSISQQVNYRDLSNKTVSLATDLQNLIEDIQTEFRLTQEGQRYRSATSKAHQQVLALAELSEERADLDTIKEQYRRFRELWYPQAANLQAQKRDYFSRSLRRIATTDGEIARLLLMQNRFDKTQVVYLTSALRKDIDEFFYYATLDMCMKLPRANQVISSASEFYGVCENFVDTVNSDSSYEEIVDAYRYIEQANRSFMNVFGSIDNDNAASALESISQTLNALRTAIQVNTDEFNRESAINLAAKIENLTDSLDITARRWLSRDRQSFAQDCLRETNKLAEQAADLHAAIVGGANVAKIRQDTETLYQTWRTVYNYLVKCQSEERASLGRSSSQLTPALVQLRTLVAN